MADEATAAFGERRAARLEQSWSHEAWRPLFLAAIVAFLNIAAVTLAFGLATARRRSGQLTERDR
ncbi:MAG: hypothetical protein ACM3VX_03550 [Bacteroidota bacterium]